MSAESTVPLLSLCNGACFVWKASVARYLREECRVVGTLVGCLPRAPRQNVHLGLPLQLMPEEVTLLIEKGLAEVVRETFEKPTKETIKKQEDRLQQSHKNQIELFRAERLFEIKRRMPEIREGKKQKRNKLLEQRKLAGESVSDSEFEAEVELAAEDIEIPPISQQNMLVQIYQGCQDKTVTYEPVKWGYPDTPIEKIRYKVFKDFWEKGHYLTSGAKFGGDFLVYPGDPSRFHSLYIVVCKPHTETMPALELVALGRLATSVKKSVVICSVNAQEQLCYTSLQWTGVS